MIYPEPAVLIAEEKPVPVLVTSNTAPDPNVLSGLVAVYEVLLIPLTVSLPEEITLVPEMTSAVSIEPLDTVATFINKSLAGLVPPPRSVPSILSTSPT